MYIHTYSHKNSRRHHGESWLLCTAAAGAHSPEYGCFCSRILCKAFPGRWDKVNAHDTKIARSFQITSMKFIRYEDELVSNQYHGSSPSNSPSLHM